MNQERELGTIREYNTDRGFGFILRGNGKSIFFHVSDVAGPEGAIQPGAHVEYEQVRDDRHNKPRAVGITLV